MTVGMYERVNEEWYWRLLERLCESKKRSEKDRNGSGSSANKGMYG